jgi:hypothetical protein
MTELQTKHRQIGRNMEAERWGMAANAIQFFCLHLSATSVSAIISRLGRTIQFGLKSSAKPVTWFQLVIEPNDSTFLKKPVAQRKSLVIFPVPFGPVKG